MAGNKKNGPPKRSSESEDSDDFDIGFESSAHEDQEDPEPRSPRSDDIEAELEELEAEYGPGADNPEQTPAGRPVLSQRPTPAQAQMGLPRASNPPVIAGASVPPSPAAQSTTISTTEQHDIKYRLVLLDDLNYADREPRRGEILINKNVQNNKLIFKTRGAQGEFIEESLDVPGLGNNTLDSQQKLLQHKNAIQNAFIQRDAQVNQRLMHLKAQAQNAQVAEQIAKEENLRLFRSEAEREQAAFDTVLKTRLEDSKGMGLNMPTGADPKHSNAGQVQHLAGLGMESLAIKMNLEMLFFFAQLGWASTAGYILAVKQYNAYAEKYPDSIYNGQPLYQYNIDSKGNFKLDKSSVVPPDKVTLTDILANGFLPKPTLLSQIKEVTQGYVIQQMGVDIDEELTKVQKHFHGMPLAEKSHDDNPDADDQEDALLAGRRPIVKPGPK